MRQNSGAQIHQPCRAARCGPPPLYFYASLLRLFTTPLYYAFLLRLFVLRLQRHYHAAAVVSNTRLQLAFVSRVRRLCKT